MNMSELIADIQSIAGSLLTVASMWQIATLVAATALAWWLAAAAKSRVPEQIEPRGWKVAAGSFNRIVFPVLALGFVALGKFVLGKFFATPLLSIAVPLFASFAAIRIAVYLLRHLIPPSPLLKASERVIVFSMWILVALYLSGLLPEFVATLSEISFSAGKQNITLMMVFTGLLTVVVTLLVAVTLSRFVERRVMRASEINLSLRLVITKLIHAFALFIAVIIALPLVGIDITVLSVFGGALGVGLGFGLQKVASNYVSGFIILLERSIRVGDLVTVDNRHGTVSSINGRYTVIKSLDGTEALLPNEMLITGTVVNHTYSDPVTSLKLPITVAYHTDLDRVTEILLGAARAQIRIVNEPAPEVLVKSLGDYGVELELVVWIGDAARGQANLRSDVYRAIFVALRDSGIEIPFPRRDVRILPIEST